VSIRPLLRLLSPSSPSAAAAGRAGLRKIYMKSMNSLVKYMKSMNSLGRSPLRFSPLHVSALGMVYSRLSKVKATMLTHYSLAETNEHALQEYKAMLLEPFFSAWCSFWPGKMKESVKKLAKSVQSGGSVGTKDSKFELDMCASFHDDISLGYLFKDLVELPDDVHDCNNNSSWKNIDFAKGDFLMFEICEDSQQLPHKVYQVERALQLRQSCISGLKLPKAVGVILNGDRADFQAIVNQLKKSTWAAGVRKPKVFDVPLYLIYTSYVNIFSDLKELKTDITTLLNLLCSKEHLQRICSARKIHFELSWNEDELISAIARLENSGRLPTTP
jgi:hypothetical protein